MPGSLNTVVQLLGRAMRPKGADCPVEHRDRARLVFFVPCAGGAALTDLSLDHSRHALLTCCFLADHQVGQEWIVLREVRRGIEDALGNPADNPAAADAENEADQALDPGVRAEVELAIAAAREQIAGDDGEPTLGRVIELAEKTRPDLPAEAFQRIATEILAAQPGSTGKQVRRAVQDEVSKRLRIDPMVKKAMEEAFGVVLEEFREVTLAQSPVLENVRRQVHGVTGGQMREFAQRLRDAAPRPLTKEQVLEWADQHHARAGDWPKIDSGPIENAEGETWANVDAALRAGVRGLPGSSSLPKLLAEHRGVAYSLGAPPLSIEQILSWADVVFEQTGNWPTRDSGPIASFPREKWANIDAALRGGARGLPGGSSLAKQLAENRGVRNRMNLPELSIEMILGWADSHRERTGSWPQVLSGEIQEAPGESWQSINMLLSTGSRGLPGGSSLAKLLAEKRGVRNTQDLPDLTKEQIIFWAQTFRKRTGKWPSRNAGAVDGAPNETWGNIDAALKQGSRGFPGRSSLAKFLGEHCGAKSLLVTLLPVPGTPRTRHSPPC